MKFNRMQDEMLTAFKNKDIKKLEYLRDNFQEYALKSQCYIDRLIRRSNKNKGSL